MSKLVIDYPHLVIQWDYVANLPLLPTTTSSQSNKAVKWRCQEGHSWSTSPGNRINSRTGCPYCSGSKVLAGYNDLETLNPLLAKEWSSDNSLLPSQVRPMSNSKVKWNCPEGHSWEAVISSRSNGAGCAVCAGKIVVPGYNDFQTAAPHLAAELSEASRHLATSVTSYSKKKALWVCSKYSEHTWEATFASRMLPTSPGCPFCSGNQVLKGFNDLATTSPEILSMWHPSNTTSPDEVTRGSGKKVTWQCSLGHTWTAKILNVVISGSRCPKCYTPSKVEKDVREFVGNLGLDVKQNDRKALAGKEIDIFLPDLSTGIEVNGLYWHSEDHLKDPNYHLKKYELALSQGVRLITVWEDDWYNRRSAVETFLRDQLLTRPLSDSLKVVELSRQAGEQLFEQSHYSPPLGINTYFSLQSDEVSQCLVALKGTTLVGFCGSPELLPQLVSELGDLVVYALTNNEHTNNSALIVAGFVKVESLSPRFCYFSSKARIKVDEWTGKSTPRKIWDSGYTVWNLRSRHAAEAINIERVMQEVSSPTRG